MISDSETSTFEQAQLRNRVARVLESGFRIAVAIIAAGLALSIIKQEALPSTLGNPRAIASGIVEADPGSILGLGILAIILTPFVSTGVIAWTFHQQGNQRYTLTSSLVLVILLISIGLSLM